MATRVLYATIPAMMPPNGPDLEIEELTAAGAELMPTILLSEAEVLANGGEADGILDAGISLSRSTLESLPRCRGVLLISHGYNHVDLDAATELGIPVANVYFCHEEVATHAMLLLLACARNLIATHNELTLGRWRRDLLGSVPPLYDQTLGIIGLGHSGRGMARRGQAFGMRVIAYGPRLVPGQTDQAGVKAVTLDDLLSEADFVSIHAPLTAQTFHLLGEAQLRAMKPSAILVNTARGQIVDQTALTRALHEGWIAGAGLDVFEQEPIAPTDPLLTLPNVVVTPHAGGTSTQSLRNGRQLAARRLGQLLRGEWIEDILNPAVRERRRM